jgi:hypothetical protein
MSMRMESTSFTESCRSCISTLRTSDPRRPKAFQRVNQKEEDPKPARQKKPSLGISFARIIEDQVEESLEWLLERRRFGLAIYLLERMSTQTLL